MAIEQIAREPLARMLRANGISPTHQRVAIAHVLFERKCHLSADQILIAVTTGNAETSKATVYNTLKLFVEKRLIRELIVDPAKIYYDSNTAPHHHFYDAESGELTDFAADTVRIEGVPNLPAGSVSDGIEIIIRTRKTAI